MTRTRTLAIADLWRAEQSLLAAYGRSGDPRHGLLGTAATALRRACARLTRLGGHAPDLVVLGLAAADIAAGRAVEAGDRVRDVRRELVRLAGVGESTKDQREIAA